MKLIFLWFRCLHSCDCFSLCIIFKTFLVVFLFGCFEIPWIDCKFSCSCIDLFRLLAKLLTARMMLSMTQSANFIFSVRWVSGNLIGTLSHHFRSNREACSTVIYQNCMHFALVISITTVTMPWKSINCTQNVVHITRWQLHRNSGEISSPNTNSEVDGLLPQNRWFIEQFPAAFGASTGWMRSHLYIDLNTVDITRALLTSTSSEVQWSHEITRKKIQVNYFTFNWVVVRFGVE